jgi:hypothetical protein
MCKFCSRSILAGVFAQSDELCRIHPSELYGPDSLYYIVVNIHITYSNWSIDFAEVVVFRCFSHVLLFL